MASFALFGPSDTDRVQPAQIVLVREHFSVWGFLLPLPYCLWHGNWRFSALLVLLGGLTGLMPSFGLPAADITLAPSLAASAWAPSFIFTKKGLVSVLVIKPITGSAAYALPAANAKAVNINLGVFNFIKVSTLLIIIADAVCAVT